MKGKKIMCSLSSYSGKQRCPFKVFIYIFDQIKTFSQHLAIVLQGWHLYTYFRGTKSLINWLNQIISVKSHSNNQFSAYSDWSWESSKLLLLWKQQEYFPSSFGGLEFINVLSKLQSKHSLITLCCLSYWPYFQGRLSPYTKLACLEGL